MESICDALNNSIARQGQLTYIYQSSALHVKKFRERNSCYLKAIIDTIYHADTDWIIAEEHKLRWRPEAQTNTKYTSV